MTINKATDFFKSLMSETVGKSEKKVYENFIGILSDLKNRDLTENQFKSIEEELDHLELEANPENRRKYFNKKLAELKKYLKEEFSFITEGYYTGLGIALGVAFGAALGSLFGPGLGISFGMIIGLAIGAGLDSEAKKKGLVLKVKLK